MRRLFIIIFSIVMTFTLVACQKEEKSMSLSSEEVVRQFYQAFNDSQIDKLASLVGDNIVHEINGVKGTGKERFMEYMKMNKRHYDEHVEDNVIMVSEDKQRVATKFTFKGKYILTDETGIPAHGQAYALEAMNYFEVKNNKIVKAVGWYDQEGWAKQVKAQ